MARLSFRRPNIERLSSRRNLRGLVRALSYEDPLLDARGRFIDLGTQIRLAAVEALAGFEEREATDGLVLALADPEPAVRAAAAHALGDRRLTGVSGSRAIDALLVGAASWRAEDDQAARESAVQALLAAHLGARAEADADADADAQADADADASPTEFAARVATLVVDCDEGPDGRDAVVLRQLSRLGPDALARAIETLIEALPTGDVRPQRLLAHLAPESVEALVGSLSRPDRAISAARALGAAHDSRAVGALSELLRRNPDPAARVAAAWALGEIRDPAAVEALLMASGDGDYDVRVAAGEAFDRLGNVAMAIAVGLVAVRGPQVQFANPPQPRSEPRLERRGPPAISFGPSRRNGGIWRMFRQRPRSD